LRLYWASSRLHPPISAGNFLSGDEPQAFYLVADGRSKLTKDWGTVLATASLQSFPDSIFLVGRWHSQSLSDAIPKRGASIQYFLYASSRGRQDKMCLSYLPYRRPHGDVFLCGTKGDCAGGRVMATEDSPSPHILYPHWQNEYQATIVELDREKLSQRVEAAETAIYTRLQQISQGSDHQAERQAIEDAVAGLRILKRDKLGSPDWEKK